VIIWLPDHQLPAQGSASTGRHHLIESGKTVIWKFGFLRTDRRVKKSTNTSINGRHSFMAPSNADELLLLLLIYKKTKVCMVAI
jgi:hypothetical protein